MTINNALFTSKTDKWDTPKSMIDDLGLVFDWDLDVCASGPNVHNDYFIIDDDGLNQKWSGLCWMNPPYGREVGKWVEKARRSKKYFIPSCTVVCLLPARTDAKWWQNNIVYSNYVVFVKGRLKFGTKESWIAHHQEIILNKKTTKKQLLSRIKKIGGAHCCQETRNKMTIQWNIIEPNLKYNEWLGSDHLVRDSAPFPSAFVVFGWLNEQQKEKLFSYGWGIEL